jgi:hypothetical protein
MLPIAELPLLAEREILDEIELKVRTNENRQRGPHHKVERKDGGEDLTGLAPGKCDHRGKRIAAGRGGSHFCHLGLSPLNLRSSSAKIRAKI